MAKLLTFESLIDDSGTLTRTVRASRVDSLSWAGGVTTVTMATSTNADADSQPPPVTHRIVQDLAAHNAMVADWALSAPGRVANTRFAIRANALAGRLTGTEVWPRNKNPHSYGRPSRGRPAKT